MMGCGSDATRADETNVAGRLLEETLPPGVWAHGALILHSAITRRRCSFTCVGRVACKFGGRMPSNARLFA